MLQRHTNIATTKKKTSIGIIAAHTKIYMYIIFYKNGERERTEIT